MYIEPTVTIIIPPPELRAVVDKTAEFVARNGPEFESKIASGSSSAHKFNFLKPGDPYNTYYLQKVREFRDASNSVASSTVTTGDATNEKDSSAPNAVQTKIKDYLEKVIVPQEPPPDFEFIAEPPSLLAQELDIVKLTAQFVAIHGRSFLTNLMNKEQRNSQFDFLRPQHGLFSYFTQLIEQYSKILMPPTNLIEDLKEELKIDVVMHKIRYRLEWTRIQDAERRREEEKAERERLQYAQIDWHDFVVVETVDYQPNEHGIFPPPTTPEQVGSRLLLEERVSKRTNNEENDDWTKENEKEEDWMDEDNEEEEDAEKISEKNGEEMAKKSMPPPPELPPSLNKVLIRKDYDPKAARKQQAMGADANKLAKLVISPITSQPIPADKVDDHVRYGLLDRRWVEDQERMRQEKMQQEEVFAPGNAIESSLKQLAERRTDIFGSGDAETEIGKKIGEEERQQQKEKVTWDGYTSSAEATRKAARANITIEDQIQQIHRMKGLVDNEGKDKVGPSMLPNQGQSKYDTTSPIQPSTSHAGISMRPPQSNQPNRIPPPPSMGAMMQSHLSSPAPHSLSPMGHPGQNPFPPPFMMPPNAPMMPLYGMGGLPSQQQPNPVGLNFNMPPPQSIGSDIPPPPPEDEPPSKRLRSEENLIPEEEFLATHSGSISIQVLVPSHPDKADMQLSGQILSLTLTLTDMVSTIKSKIYEQTKLPAGKQKLQYEGIFIKDNNTLAFYNMTNGSQIQLALKERGGRKK